MKTFAALVAPVALAASILPVSPAAADTAKTPSSAPTSALASAPATGPAANLITTAPLAPPLSEPDPVRLAAARTTVDAVFPSGTYARLMSGTMDQMMDSMTGSMMQMPLKDLAAFSGIDTSKLGKATLAQIMEIYDPAFHERTRLGVRAMMREMTTMMSGFEPELRDGMARAYAQRFNARQLGELNAFFATPTGKAYAAQSYVIMMSTEVMAKMQAFMPQMMKQMPAIADKAKAATAGLPAPRSYETLSDAEKNKLAELLGTTRKNLEKNADSRSK